LVGTKSQNGIERELSGQCLIGKLHGARGLMIDLCAGKAIRAGQPAVNLNQARAGA
jgi:hypothetical protein